VPWGIPLHFSFGLGAQTCCQSFRTNLEVTTHQPSPRPVWESAECADVPDASISATVSFQSLRSTSGESSTRIACSEKCGINTRSLWGSCSGSSGKCASAWHVVDRCQSTMRTCKCFTSPVIFPNIQTESLYTGTPSATVRHHLRGGTVIYRPIRCGYRSIRKRTMT
jgi:hypothetical protein